MLSAGAPHFTKLPRTYLAICPCFGDAFDIVHHLLDCLKLNIDSRAKLYQKCQTGVLGTFLPSVSRSSDQRVPNIAGSETKLYLVFQVQCSESNSEAAIYICLNAFGRFCKCYVPNDTPSWQQHTQGSGHTKAKSEHLRKLGRWRKWPVVQSNPRMSNHIKLNAEENQFTKTVNGHL